jgi:large subunit ribosomal protein L6
MSSKLSRVGKQIIKLPTGTNCELKKDSNGNDVAVISKGSMSAPYLVPRDLTLRSENHKIWLEVNEGSAVDGAAVKTAAGTFVRNVMNVIAGQTSPFSRELQIDGVGYKARVDSKYLTLSLGYSNDIKCIVPAGINIEVGKTGQIIIKGPMKDKVMDFANFLTRIRKFNPYTGKGVLDKKKNNPRKEVNKK